MKTFIAALSVVAACSVALAQDDPTKKPEPAPPGADKAEPAAPAKKERKVDPEAMKTLERYVSLVHIPQTSGLKSLAGKGSLEGKKISIDPKWSADSGFDLDIEVEEVPDELRQLLEAQGLPAEMITPEVAAQVIQMQIGIAGINAAFEAPGRNWEHYDVAFKQSGEDQVVELTPFDQQADADSRTYVFGKDGLLKSSSMAPSGNSAQGAQLKAMGITFDSTSTFEKKGERYVIATRTMTMMGQETETRFSYFDGPNGSFLLKEAAISSMQGEETIRFHDYTVDGKLVDSTKAEAAKPAAPPKEAEKPAEKPTEPAPTPKEGEK